MTYFLYYFQGSLVTILFGTKKNFINEKKIAAVNNFLSCEKKVGRYFNPVIPLPLTRALLTRTSENIFPRIAVENSTDQYLYFDLNSW